MMLSNINGWDDIAILVPFLKIMPVYGLKLLLACLTGVWERSQKGESAISFFIFTTVCPTEIFLKHLSFDQLNANTPDGFRVSGDVTTV